MALHVASLAGADEGSNVLVHTMPPLPTVQDGDVAFFHASCASSTPITITGGLGATTGAPISPTLAYGVSGHGQAVFVRVLKASDSGTTVTFSTVAQLKLARSVTIWRGSDLNVAALVWLTTSPTSVSNTAPVAPTIAGDAGFLYLIFPTSSMPAGGTSPATTYTATGVNTRVVGGMGGTTGRNSNAIGTVDPGTNPAEQWTTDLPGLWSVMAVGVPLGAAVPDMYYAKDRILYPGQVVAYGQGGVVYPAGEILAPGEVPATPAPQPGAVATANHFADLSATSDKPLAFEAARRMVFAHYFPPYPRVFQPTGDYYSDQYLKATGESSKNIATGGLLRDAPMRRVNPYPDIPTPGYATFRKRDAALEVDWAAKAGIDAFLIDLLDDLTGQNHDYSIAIRDAANDRGGDFKAIPMLDATWPSFPTQGVNGMAAIVAEYVGQSSTYTLPDGRMVVAVFKVEDSDSPPSWYQQFIARMKAAYGVDVALIGSMNSYTTANVTAYAPYFHALGPWGLGGDPASITASSNVQTVAAAAGIKAMGPVGAYNVRPNQSTFDESANTEGIVAAWSKASREGWDYVQIVTWNDLSEGASHFPSRSNGFSRLDMDAYYIHQYKTGALPPIAKDAVLISHRTQFSSVNTSAEVAGPQTVFMTQATRPTRTTLRDTVETRVWLTAPADVTITIGSSTYTHANAPAGMSAWLHPLAVAAIGGITAKVTRAGEITADVANRSAVTATPYNEDKNYHSILSSHPLTGLEVQHDPTENNPIYRPGYTAPTPPPVATSATPGSVLNIGPEPGQNHYSVQVAVVGDTTQSHSMNEITNGYSRTEEFTRNSAGTRVRMKTYVNAPILDNSSWPRCELRERNLDGSMAAFNILDGGTHWQHQRGRILTLPPNKSEIVLSQLHNGASDRIALRVQDVNGVPRLIWRVNGVQVYVFKDPLIPASDPAYDGYEYRAMWRVENKVVKLYDGNMTTPVYTSSATTLKATSGVNTWYAKAGNYVQSTDGSQPQNPVYYDDAGQFGSVEIWDLRHWHTGWAPNALGDPLGT